MPTDHGCRQISMIADVYFKTVRDDSTPSLTSIAGVMMRKLVRRKVPWMVPTALVGALAIAPTAVVAAQVTPTERAASTASAAAPTDAELREALDAIVAAGATGAALRVDDGANTVRLASGVARRNPEEPLRPEARVRVGSITKTLVSTLVLQQVGEERLGLEDPIEQWLPGLVPDGDKITIRQLLNHTSGIYNYTEDPIVLLRLVAHPLHEYTPTEIVNVATRHRPTGPPGEKFSYSNTNYIVLGMILEKVTERPIDQLVQQRILEPLGMGDSTWPITSPDIDGYHARGYVPPSISFIYLDYTRVSPTAAWAAGALISNPDNLRRFYAGLLSGRLLKPAQLEQMKTTVPVQEDRGYGLGLFNITTPCGEVWGHDGAEIGYATVSWNDESGKRGFTLAVPTQPDTKIREAVVSALEVANCRALGKPLPATSATSKAKQLEGPGAGVGPGAERRKVKFSRR
jgi:D-alanyl-D-alanine carboxypeptidase